MRPGQADVGRRGKTPGRERTDPRPLRGPRLQGPQAPPTAYVAIKNRGYWYYIDDRDQASKSTLALVLQLSRLDFGTQKATGPILTLPVGR